MLVYLLAAEMLIAQNTAPDAPTEVAGGVFWRVGGDQIGIVMGDDHDTISTGKDHLRRYLDLARKGDFAAHANKLDSGRCAKYCDFHQMCRQSITHKRKR